MKKKSQSKWTWFHETLPPARASMVIMGSGQLLNGQIVKGILYLVVLVVAVYYFITSGVTDIVGFFTLGTTEEDPWLSIKGDDSIMMMLHGILAFIILMGFLLLYYINVKDAQKNALLRKNQKKVPGLRQELMEFLDKKFYVASLVLPVIGVCVFSILPIVFMILLAFTNYGGNIVPPKLVDWVGLKNFKTIFALSEVAGTFRKIFTWNIIWAVSSTFLNYFAGLFLALLLNKKCVRGRKIWRAFPILAYAIPGFITLLGFKFMFSYGGPINYYITNAGHSAVGFLDLDAKWTARIIGLLVNAWISIPTSMLLATGILSNMNQELYEAASIDGASKWKQFKSLTLPFVIFSTTPVLITNFIGNFNNFGVFFFLRDGLYMDGYFLASDTDLLINWMYNMSINNNYYSIGAALSLVIFVITSIFSLIVYVNSKSYKREDMYR